MFRLIKILNGRGNTAEPCILPSTASETYRSGEALVLASGALTKCGATAKPTHIAAQDYTAPAENTKPLFVYPVGAGMVFECPVSVVPTGIFAGDKVTLSADGMGVTATKTNGVATVYDLCGATAAGDKILVAF